MPTVATIAPKTSETQVVINGKPYPMLDSVSAFTYPFNFVGAPSLTIPIGMVEGMPVGMQLVSGRMKENILFNVGESFQSITKYHLKSPDFASW